MLNFIIIFAPTMKPNTSIIKHFLRRKLVTVLFIVASVAAFATLGDGGDKRQQQSKKLLSTKPGFYNYKNFTLKSHYNWRGNTVITKKQEEKYITLNNVISLQRGNSTYILPMKRKVLLDKIKFNPASTR